MLVAASLSPALAAALGTVALLALIAVYLVARRNRAGAEKPGGAQVVTVEEVERARATRAARRGATESPRFR
jgi:hypothetical protein